MFLSSKITVLKQLNVPVVSSVIHVKVGYDYKKIMRNSSIPSTVYPHQRDRAGVRDELAAPKYVWHNVQTTMTLWVVFVIWDGRLLILQMSPNSEKPQWIIKLHHKSNLQFGALRRLIKKRRRALIWKTKCFLKEHYLQKSPEILKPWCHFAIWYSYVLLILQ